MTTEREALIRSLTGLVGRARGFRVELEAYQNEVRRSAGGPEATPFMAALAEVLGAGDLTGSLRRVETAASRLLGRLVVEAPEVELRGGGGRSDEVREGRSEGAPWA
jgi:hypothetical protein